MQQTLDISLIAQTQDDLLSWKSELEKLLAPMKPIQVVLHLQAPDVGSVVFIDESLENLDELLTTLDRRNRAIFLIVRDPNAIPDGLVKGLVDDVVVAPFRLVEILGKLKWYQQILLWDEVQQINMSFTEVIERFHSDLQIADRIQKSRVPIRFPDLKGFKARSRYLSGMKSGGDYFDVSESTRSKNLSLILTDSSSYGLSSAVLSVLVKVALKLSADHSKSASEVVRKISEELMVALGDKDQLSLFYGLISRKDLVLKYLNLGESVALLGNRNGYEILSSNGPALRADGKTDWSRDHSIQLKPEDRLVLVSDGFVEAVGGPEKLQEVLNEQKDKDAQTVLNELAFYVKRTLQEDELPNQDCTAVVLDVETNVIRLAN